ncbi:MAG TPA: allophanate hydrolase [Hansschlegelia sp.]
MPTKLADLPLDLAALRAAYADGLDPVAVVDEVFDRIAALDDPGVFITLADREQARAAARALGARPDGRALWGVPFAVKDNIDVAGLPTTCACPDFAYTARADAVSVERAKAAGAIVVGKTNLDQFATGLVGVRTPYPAPKNAVDPELVPGGSSSGSAVAVARGLVSFALGTDTAGSGRVPAGLNNIVGLKPTVGATPPRGVVPAVRMADVVTVFAQTVDDAYTAYSAIGGYDAADGFSRDVAIPPLGALPPKLRIAVPDAASRRFGGSAEAAAAFDATLEDLKALGAELTPFDLEPYFAVARMLYEDAIVASRYDAIRAFFDASPEALHPVTRAITESGRRFDAANAFHVLYRLTELRRELGGLWTRFDAMIVPTYPRPHTVADVLADPIALNSELGAYTNFVNLLDFCAIATPGRPRADAKPAGVTLIGRAGADALVAAIAEALHEAGGVPVGAIGRLPPKRPKRAAAIGPDDMELVVVGAHLSGMALNHEVTSRGGRFLRAVDTKPCYRLYAVPGKIERPGLIRVPDGDGAAIATEVWALPRAAFGDFALGVGAPLGFGTLLLADGTTPKGFLAEPEGVRGTEDITGFGGWRAYVGSKISA